MAKRKLPDTDNVNVRLASKIALLDAPAALVLESYVDSLALPSTQELVAGSDIVDPAFAGHFLTRLRFHHAANDEVLNKKSFEFAFRGACLAVGRKAEITTSSTHPGQDIVVDGVAFSLKTEADKQISSRSLKISKFMVSV